MNPIELLQHLGLDRHLPAFQENGIDAETLLTLTDADLKGLGIAKMSDRKRILAEIEKLRTGDPSLDGFCQAWPAPVSIPLREYLAETHPVAKLWAACDTVEMLLRLLVIARVAERAQEGGLPESLRRCLAEVIETPTLGAWFLMAQALAEHGSKEPLLAEATAFIDGPLRDLLYGPSKPGTPETSFLRLRNRMAHGGGLIRKEAARLMGLWQEKFQQMLHAAAFLKDWELLGRDEAGIWRRLRGPDGREESAQPLELGGDLEADAVWLCKNDRALLLWPLMLFGKPASEAETGRRVGPEDKPQVYSRRDSVRLAYTPLGMDGMAQSESGPSALEAFEALFRVERSREQTGFKVADCLRDIHKDAAQMVGRQRELEQVQAAIHVKEQGVLWLSGSAGMGKSFLMGKLAADLLGEHHGSRTLVLPYRFRLGDQGRCSREALAQFTVERLQAAGVLKDVFQDKEEAKAEQRLEQALGLIQNDVRVVLLLDGLDEVVRRDTKFAEEISLGLRFPRVLWVCAGRPEAGIEAAMRRLAAQTLFPEGLPPMRGEDIREMVIEKIGPLRKRLLAQDQEKGDAVVNPFIEMVTQRAAGLPLYVRYVIGDVLNGKYRVLDGQEHLPASLHAYHEELLRRLAVGDLQAVVTPLAATLACAYEPLALHELEALFAWRKLVRAGDGRELLERGLAAIASMITTAPDPEGETGYTLFHQSLRDHILGSAQISQSVSMAREVFADVAVAGDGIPNCLQHYSIRCGVRHLLVVDRKEEAERLLLDLEHLERMDGLGVAWTDLYRWWMALGGEERAKGYVRSVKQALSGKVEEAVLKRCRIVVSLAQDAMWLETGTKTGQMIMEASESALGLQHPDTLSCMHDLGILLAIHKCDYDSAEVLFRRALAGFENALAPGHPDTLRVVDSLADVLRDKADYMGAETLYRRELECLEKSLGPAHHETRVVAGRLASVLKMKGDNKAAELMCERAEVDEEAMARRALEESEKSLGPEHPFTLDHVFILGMCLFSYENRANEEAEALFRRAMGGYEKVLGPEHPNTLDSIGNLTSLLEEKADYSGAEALSRRALAGSEGFLGPDHPRTLYRIRQLGILLMVEGDYNEAEAVLRRALAGHEKVFGPEHLDTLYSLSWLGRVLSREGSYARAEPLLRRALAGFEKLFGPDHSNTHTTVYELGMTLLWRLKCAEAEPLLLREFTATKSKEGEFSNSAQGSALAYATCLRVGGRLAEAVSLLRNYLDSDPDQFRYTLACYECLSGNLDEAKRLIAEEIATEPAAREQALKDDGLKPIHDFIRSFPAPPTDEGQHAT